MGNGDVVRFVNNAIDKVEEPVLVIQLLLASELLPGNGVLVGIKMIVQCLTVKPDNTMSCVRGGDVTQHLAIHSYSPDR